jgi:hypothetical protein
LAQVYTPTRQIVAVERFEYPLDMLATDIQREYDRQGLNCYVNNIWKIRGEKQDTLVVETLAPSSSPVSELIVMGIIGVILAIISAVVIVYTLSFLERWFDFREKRWEELFHDVIVGLGHGSVDEMIKWKMENYPEEYAKRPYYCPYCGAEFSTEEDRNAHMEICPEAPAPPPKYPTPPKFGFGLISYLISLIGYKISVFRIPWLRR